MLLYGQGADQDKYEGNIMVHFTRLARGQTGRHFTDNIFKCISLSEEFCILIQISLVCSEGPNWQ